MSHPQFLPGMEPPALAPFQGGKPPVAGREPPLARTGKERKERGIAAAASSKSELVAYAREIACDVARGVLPHADGRVVADGLCNADDVAANWPADKPPLGNSAGAIFRFSGWEQVGFTTSKRPHMQATDIRIWRKTH